MRYLLIVDLTLTAFGAAMSLAVGFVALVFTLNRDSSPKMEAGLPGVLIITACFIALFVVAGLAGLLLRRGLRWHWAAQTLLAVTLPVLWQTVFTHLQSS